MTDFPGEPVEGGDASQDATLYLSPSEWAIVWAHLLLAPNPLNAGIRLKVERYFEACGVPATELQQVANQARALAGAFTPVDPGESGDAA